MGRFTQRRESRNGQRRTRADDIRMAALEALLPEEKERNWKLKRPQLDTYRNLRGEVVLYAEARGYKLGQVAKSREDRDDPTDVSDGRIPLVHGPMCRWRTIATDDRGE